jgi:hypothetical protein
MGHVFEAKRAPDLFKVAFFRSLVFFFLFVRFVSVFPLLGQFPE